MTAERSRNHNTYHRVTTSFEYVLVGNDFALASPVQVCTVQVDKKNFHKPTTSRISLQH